MVALGSHSWRCKHCRDTEKEQPVHAVALRSKGGCSRCETHRTRTAGFQARLHRCGLQGAQRNALVQRIARHDLPVVEHAQAEGLSLRVAASEEQGRKFCGRSRCLSDRQNEGVRVSASSVVCTVAAARDRCSFSGAQSGVTHPAHTTTQLNEQPVR